MCLKRITQAWAQAAKAGGFQILEVFHVEFWSNHVNRGVPPHSVTECCDNGGRCGLVFARGCRGWSAC